MGKGTAETATHERDFGAEMVRQVAAHHRGRYVTVLVPGQKSSAGRRVPVEFAILQHVIYPR